MIFIDMNIDEWLKAHPYLSLDKVKCKCGCLSEVKPFVVKDYVGLKSSTCPVCGRYGSSFMISTDKYLG